jgi:ElaB/YqjD/DUF883 family membrane-anchored ribosome-binding protein
MPNRNQERGFDRAVGETKRQVSNVANAADTAARKMMSSFETAAREVIENQLYKAIGIALAIGWLLVGCIDHYIKA